MATLFYIKNDSTYLILTYFDRQIIIYYNLTEIYEINLKMHNSGIIFPLFGEIIEKNKNLFSYLK